MEVNANYQRKIGDRTGRSAFIFFKDVLDIKEIKSHLEAGRGENKISADAYIAEIPSSEQLSEHKNPRQIANEKLLNPVTQAIEALTEAYTANLPRKTLTSINYVKLQITALKKNLEENNDMTTSEFEPLLKEATDTIQLQCGDIINRLNKNERGLPKLQKLLACIQ
jgi:hypothetical protein